MAGHVVDQMLLDQLTLPGGQHPLPVGDLVAEQVHQLPRRPVLGLVLDDHHDPFVHQAERRVVAMPRQGLGQFAVPAADVVLDPLPRLVAVLHGGQLLFHQPGQPHRRCCGLGRRQPGLATFQVGRFPRGHPGHSGPVKLRERHGQQSRRGEAPECGDRRVPPGLFPGLVRQQLLLAPLKLGACFRLLAQLRIQLLVGRLELLDPAPHHVQPVLQLIGGGADRVAQRGQPGRRVPRRFRRVGGGGLSLGQLPLGPLQLSRAGGRLRKGGLMLPQRGQQLLGRARIAPHRNRGHLERGHAGRDPEIGGGLIPPLRRLGGHAVRLGHLGPLLLHLPAGLPQRDPGAGRLPVRVTQFLVTRCCRDLIGKRGQPHGHPGYGLLGHSQGLPHRVDLGGQRGEPAPPRLLPGCRSDELGGRLGPGPVQWPHPPPSVRADPGGPGVVRAKADGPQDGLDNAGRNLAGRGVGLVDSRMQRVRETATSHGERLVDPLSKDAVPGR